MSELTTKHWHYLHGKPTIEADLKSQIEDFVVIEDLGYEPCGEGEHIYLWIEKQGLNTAFVAEQIAKFCQLPLRAVSYAGRKDKYALTRQWIGVHVPGKQEFDWQNLTLNGLRIVKAIRHNKKLRTGALKGNRFEIRLRNISDTQPIAERLERIAQFGVPNYFGEQRFGHQYENDLPGNLQLAQKMLQGEVIRNRNKRSMAISALRSWLFNEFVDKRLISGNFDHLLNGDICILSGSNSFFCAEKVAPTLTKRLLQRDILLSAPLWGTGHPDSQSQALQLESEVAQQHKQVCELLENLGLKQERRPITLFPEALEWQIQQQDLLLSFGLPSGCFATSVVREITLLRSI